MKRQLIPIIILLLGFHLAAQTDHLLMTEVVLQPSAGQYVKIFNPTAGTVDLTNYYLSDATDTVNQRYYYRLPSGSDYWSLAGSDFIARFPAGLLLAPQAEIIIALTSSANYQTTYGMAPDLSVKTDFLPAVTGQTTIGTAPSYLSYTAEGLVLFYWDGTSAIVQDVDYLIWGSRLCAVDKRHVAGYLPDTPVIQQRFAASHAVGQKLQRSAGEGTEIQSGGNGITGHDETSEPLDQTWQVVPVGNVKPKIASITINPQNPTTADAIKIQATVTDDDGLASVHLIYRCGGPEISSPMNPAINDLYELTIGPFSPPDTLFYRIKAIDNTGLESVSNIFVALIQAEPEPLTIAMIRQNWAMFNGETVTLEGVVTIGSNILRTDRTSAYFQDRSGRGINLYSASITNLARGDSLTITGTLELFSGVIELTNWTGSYQVLAKNRPVPGLTMLPIQTLNDDLANREGSFVEVHATVVERADNIGGGSNIVIEDYSGRTTLRIWNSTNVLYNSINQLVNPGLDTLLQIGKEIVVRGVVGVYSSSAQLLAGYAADIYAYVEGEPGSERVLLKVQPFPFVPQLGELLGYEYEYPSNNRVILRVYDLAGRYITTLEDNYFAVAWHRTGRWNGRDELNRVVTPGVYLFQLETTNRTTGKTVTRVAPAVVGVKFK